MENENKNNTNKLKNTKKSETFQWCYVFQMLFVQQTQTFKL